MSRVRETASDIAYEDSWAVAAAPGRQMPAWLLSVCFHAAVFLAFGLLAGSPQSQPSTTPVRSAGIALVQRDRERVTYYSEAPPANRAGEGQLSPASAQPGGPGTSPFPSLDQLPVGLAAELPSRDALRVAAGAGPSLPGADSLTPGSVRAGSARGWYDHAGLWSQRDRQPIRLCLRPIGQYGRLCRPADSGGQTGTDEQFEGPGNLHQFLIIFYNEQPSVFNPGYPNPPMLVFGTDSQQAPGRRFHSADSACRRYKPRRCAAACDERPARRDLSVDGCG